MLFVIIILFIGAMIMLKVKENIRMDSRRHLIEKRRSIERQQINESIHIIMKELEKHIKIDELLQGAPATHLIGHHRM